MTPRKGRQPRESNVELPGSLQQYIENFPDESNLVKEDAKETCNEYSMEYINWDAESKEDCVDKFIDNRSEYYPKIVQEIENARTGGAIYRAMDVDYAEFKKEIVGGKHPAGVYWSWNEDTRPQWGTSKPDLVVLKGRVVHPDSIDVHSTIATNIRFINEEKEIRLKEGSKIILDEICVIKGENKKCDRVDAEIIA